MGWIDPGTQYWVSLEPLLASKLNVMQDNLRDLHRRTTVVPQWDAGSGSTSSTTYTDLTAPANVGPAVSADIGGTGRALVALYSSLQHDVAGGLAVMSYQITGASSYGPVDGDAVSFQAAQIGYSARIGAVHVAAGLNVGLHTFRCKYRADGGQANFRDRRIAVTPLGS